MAFQYKMDITGNEIFKTKIVGEAVLTALVAGEVAIMITDAVDPLRNVEIDNGLQFLMNGIRDRDLLGAEGFADVGTYTAAKIDDLTIPDRRTTSLATVIEDGDIVVAIAAGTITGHSFSVMLETAFTQLRDYATENGWS